MVINKYLAELVGTFILVIVGSMSLVGAGQAIILVVPFGFGLGLLAALYAVGHVSGGHFNPAVTLGMFLDKRTSGQDLIGYWIAQFVGGLLASLALLAMVNREAVASTATTHPQLTMGILSELILTTIFVLVILSSTKTAPATAAVGISLTLVAVHFAGLPFSGASVNPARSFAPAVVGGTMQGLWVYLVFPLIGGAVAWGLWQLFQPGADEVELPLEDDHDVHADEVRDVTDDSSTGLPEPGEGPEPIA